MARFHFDLRHVTDTSDLHVYVHGKTYPPRSHTALPADRNPGDK